MPKQTFRLRKNLILNILFSFSSVTLTLFGLLIALPSVAESTHAEGDEPDDGISIVVSDSISANVTLFDEGDYKIAKDTVSVSSGAPYGYELFLTTDSEAHQSIYLNDDPTSSSKISPVSGTIDEPAVLTSNTWGFAIAGQGNFGDEYSTANPDPASRFAIIPTADDQQAVFENDAATAEDNVDFYYGIKVEPTLEVGRYTTGATYTAIAKEKPRTAKAILGDNGNFNFVYDRNTYTAGNTYADNLGETTITKVYTVPMNSVGCNANTLMPWYFQRNSVTKANIDTSFVSARPTGTCGWFNNMTRLTTITGLQNLNTDSVTDMSYMFYNAGSSATTWDIGDLSGWNTGSVTNMFRMFTDAGRNATTWNIGDLDGWNTENVSNMQSMFQDAGRSATTWNIGDLSGWNTENVSNMQGMFQGAGYSATTWDIGNLSGWNTGSVTNMSSMFYSAGYSATTWDIGDISGWNVTKVTNHGSFITLNSNSTNASVVNNQPNWPS